MRLRSLESRIVLLFLLLIVSVQLAGFMVIRTGIDENARRSIQEELAVGQRVFLRLLDQYGETLTQGARVLAADYGFRDAVASNDKETIISALENHGERIGTSLALFIAPNRTVTASTLGRPLGGLEQTILQLVGKAEIAGSATGISVFENQPYQIVVVPVKAPVVIGWVAMGFSVGSKLVDDMRELSLLQASILTGTAGGQWVFDASSLPEGDRGVLANRLQMAGGDGSAMSEPGIAGEDYSASLLVLSREADQKIVVILQRSISEAVAPYRRLQLTLLALTLVGIAVAVAGSAFMARRITGPLRQLTGTARRMGAGDYNQSLQIKGDDEIGELSKAFESMRDGIARREAEIRRLAYWDNLTGLPNRAQFANLLREAIDEARLDGGTCHVLMMDLNRFKNVNDVLGQSFGDALLRKVAERLTAQTVDLGYVAARLGGDEFAVLLAETGIDDAKTIASRILRSLELPLSVDDQNVDLGAGIGVAGFPAHGADPETLLKNADGLPWVR